ncbi:hypothetical protein GJAV_G00009380 [Gymnothorax javanicus]|nr:hypothetical protein GJAV_G00009380 [Gymnothorax javanicus]
MKYGKFHSSLNNFCALHQAKHSFTMSDKEGENDNGSKGAQLRQQLNNKKPQIEDKGKPRSWSRGRREREGKEGGGKEKGRRGAGRSRSSDTERRGRRRETRRSGERESNKGQRRERGRSEERRDRDEGQPGSTEHEDDIEDTECVVCFCAYDNVFKTPKLLSCGHTFCLECLARINVSSTEIKSLTCPVCRELTDLPHGRDLPHLDNNQEIFSKLPPEMQRALSVRFKRSKGKLVLKKPLAGTHSGPSKPSLTIPNFKKKVKDEPQGAGSDQHLRTQDASHIQATIVDVGRPPNRVRGRLRQLFRSDQCYYATVASIITVAVALMLVGILAFVVVPNIAHNNSQRPPPANNSLAENGQNSGP